MREKVKEKEREKVKEKVREKEREKVERLILSISHNAASHFFILQFFYACVKIEI